MNAKNIVASLGLETGTIEPRKQEVCGTLLGWKQSLTKATAEKPARPMWVLYFADANGEVETINMMATSDRVRLESGHEYSARWYGQEFQIVPGAQGFVTEDGDIVLDEE